MGRRPTVPVMANVSIRAERPDDHDAIRTVVAAAFRSAAEADLVERIRASPEYLPDGALVAVDDDGAVVGHVMVSGATLTSDDGTRRAIVMLSPLAVAPDRQGQGIGGALVRAALDVADARGEPFVVLEGSPVYYSRFGFQPAASHDITLPLPDWAAPEAAQVARLTNDDPAFRGRVVYPAAFDGLE